MREDSIFIILSLNVPVVFANIDAPGASAAVSRADNAMILMLMVFVHSPRKVEDRVLGLMYF